MKKANKPHFKERSFGVSVGGVLIAVAAYMLWRGRLREAAIAGGIGAMLVVLGQAAPRLLKWPSAAWWAMATVLGYLNARIILTVVFVFVLTPIGLVWRVFGHDPLARRRERWPGWTPTPDRFRNPDHFTRMY